MPEELQPLEKLPFWLRPLEEERKPHYTDCEKRIIAWAIAFEGTLTIDKHTTISKTKEYTHYRPNIAVSNTNFELLHNFVKIVKLGSTHIDKTPRKDTWERSKVWSVKSVYEAIFILQQLKGYMVCKKYRKLRNLVSEFCQSRIEQHGKGKREAPYSERELEIVRIVRKLNLRGRRK